jgi:hypothetical protein
LPAIRPCGKQIMSALERFVDDNPDLADEPHSVAPGHLPLPSGTLFASHKHCQRSSKARTWSSFAGRGPFCVGIAFSAKLISNLPPQIPQARP